MKFPLVRLFTATLITPVLLTLAFIFIRHVFYGAYFGQDISLVGPQYNDVLWKRVENTLTIYTYFPILLIAYVAMILIGIPSLLILERLKLRKYKAVLYLLGVSLGVALFLIGALVFIFSGSGSFSFNASKFFMACLTSSVVILAMLLTSAFIMLWKRE